ncbi:zinc finger BED domain-containing protein RICESLEEPER 2-like [Hibiscus syriacus]|uniref:zinc finger BED domain-containing protein RICESLEEPER 2-like n=1 Tax=Hibiscus syriacus TaxID=106335 RepID=UPI0019235CE1|nr:zinc finger BED domain-containing protein RICESLEEPER 2-like [Hibiscus syriacus]
MIAILVQIVESEKLTSVVWNHFEKVNVNGEDKAECRYCKKKLGANNIRQQVIGMGQKTTDGQTNLSCLNFDPEKSRKDIAEMVIVHEYPLVMVEHHGFRKFMVGLQPLFKVPSRNTLKNDILKIYDFEKEKTMRLLEKIRSKIAITTDMWTSSNQKKGFMSITSHLIDDNWEMQSRIMRFIYVPCPHTAEVLADVLYESLCDWNIDRKISTVTVDNCSTNDLMIHLLLDKLSLNSLILGGELFHMRCCAHILNLIVQDGLSVIGDGIERIRDSVYFWSATQKRIEKFEEAARHLAIDCSKKLSLDCKTRWNSTYLMLSVAIVYKDVFKCLKQRETQYRSLPTDRDWELASSICGKLQLFYKVTLMFSGTRNPTANVFFPSICEIRIALSRWSEDRDELIKAMGERMLVKFDKYWSVIHGVMGVAVVLDPRYKFKMMEYAFPKIYGFEKSDVEIVKLKELVSRLFQDYETCSYESSQNRDVDSSRNTSDMEVEGGITSELDHYLQEKVRTQNSELDILSWWKTNGFKYPTLQKIARDILAIPISTVASESAFSTSGRLQLVHKSPKHIVKASNMTVMILTSNWGSQLFDDGGGVVDVTWKLELWKNDFVYES